MAWFAERSSWIGWGVLAASFLAIFYVRAPGGAGFEIGRAASFVQGAGAATMIGWLISQPGERLSHPLFQYFGDVSYSVYLWHVVILVVAIKFLAGALPVAVIMVTALVITFVVATFTFRFVELPFMRLSKRLTVPRRVATHSE